MASELEGKERNNHVLKNRSRGQSSALAGITIKDASFVNE